MPFSEAVKLEVKNKADFTCCWCKERRNKVEIHHIVPQADGGADDLDNAAPLCGSCHDLLGNNPDLRKEMRSRRDFWYADCAGTSVRDAATAEPADGETAPARVDVKPQRRQRRFTAVLELRGCHVARRYGQPPYYELHASRVEVDLRRLESMAEEELGHELFRILLGGKRECAEVLAKVYGGEVSDPLRHAFRVRIRSDDPALRALPWAACRWRDDLLVDEGWSFELALGDRPRPVEHLHTPCRALMVAGEDAALPALFADAHGKSLESVLGHSWNLPLKATLLHRVRTRSELASELDKAPDLLYVYGRARDNAGELELLLPGDGDSDGDSDGDGATAVSFAELAARLAERPPRVVVLNTLGDGPPAPPLPGVPAFLHLRHPGPPDDTRPARMAVAAWWEAVLGSRRDPVRAFCNLSAEIRRHGAITTDYREWVLDHSEYVPKVDRPRAHLDRRDQRRVVLEAVEELVRKPRRRITCLVAYGAEENLVEHFAVQMLATLKERARNLARLHHHRLDLPAERDALDRARIEEVARFILNLQPSDPLAAAFRKARPGGPRAKPVHFLDWGTCGEGHQPRLSLQQLATWLTFCRDDLEGACPGGGRILAYLSLVVAEEQHSRLDASFKQMKLDLHRPHFDLVALPALGRVEPEDLLRFLEDEHNSSCPPALQGDLPARIAAATGGSFEATVKLLEDTERGNRWYELDEELPRVAPETEVDWDQPL